MPSCLFIFLQRYQSFHSFLLISLHLPHLFTFSPTLQLPLFSYKTFCLLLISSSLTIWTSLSFSNSFILSHSTQAESQENLLHDFRRSLQPYMLGWSHILTESPPLIYKPQDHLFEGARIGLESFLKFSHFQVLLWSSILIYFWTYKCLDFVIGWF